MAKSTAVFGSPGPVLNLLSMTSSPLQSLSQTLPWVSKLLGAPGGTPPRLPELSGDMGLFSLAIPHPSTYGGPQEHSNMRKAIADIGEWFRNCELEPREGLLRVPPSPYICCP